MDSIKNYPENESWQLGLKDMPVVTSTTHIGILRTSTNQEMNNVETNIQKAKRTIYSLMGSGLHGENGLDPETAISLLQSKKISNDQELIQSDPISCPQNQKGNN